MSYPTGVLFDSTIGEAHAVNRIPPSRKIRQEIEAVLRGDGCDIEDLVTRLVRLGIQRVAQEALEQEAADALGRGHYVRRQEGEPLKGYRNGYRPAVMDTAEGRIPLSVPQVRDTAEPYRSRLITFLRGHTDVLQRLAVEMYTRGLSVRDVEAVFAEVTGDALLSRSAVSELTDKLWEEYEIFASRDLSDLKVVCVFLDGVYESLRRLAGLREGILVAWGILEDGRKVLLHMALGNRESYEAWRDMLRDMKARGLPDPVLYTTDGAPGLIRAAEEVWPNSLRQRCLAHKTRNVLEKVAEVDQPEVKAAVRAAYYAPTREVAELAAADVLRRYQDRYPSAMRSFQEDLEACWAHLRCPAVHHKRIRTTNLLERAFVEQRRRTKIIPGFLTERSCIKLVFATLWQASQRWQNVRMTEFELMQLEHLRRELGMTPPPASGQKVRRAA